MPRRPISCAHKWSQESLTASTHDLAKPPQGIASEIICSVESDSFLAIRDDWGNAAEVRGAATIL
eukprot:12866422-Alexandrium_andersonii.AAC.1